MREISGSRRGARAECRSPGVRHRNDRGAGRLEGRIPDRRKGRRDRGGPGRFREGRRASGETRRRRAARQGKKSEAAQRQAAANLAKTEAQRARAEITYQQKKNVNARRQTLASRGSVSQEAAEDAQAAEEIALGDAKVIEADTKVAAVQQDDASVAAQDRRGRPCAA